MKRVITHVGMLFLTLLMANFPVQGAPSVTMTAPTANTTLSCTTTVQATVNLDGWMIGGTMLLQIKDFNGVATQVTMGPKFANTFGYDWNTLGVANGNYTLQGFANLYKPGPPAAQNTEVITALVPVTVKNGYEVVVDTAKVKTYAKVTSPTAGQKIGSNFTFPFNSDHRVTFNRFDNCGPYTVTYGSYHVTTNPQVPAGNQNNFTKTLPLIVGEIPYTWSLANNQTNIGALGYWVANAYTESPVNAGAARPNGVVAQDSVPWETVPAQGQ